MNRSGITNAILTLSIIIVASGAFYFVKKYYVLYNLLRLDPLELNSAKMPELYDTLHLPQIWMIGDSRISQWDKNRLSSDGYNIENFGIEGQTTSQVLYRLQMALNIYNTPGLIMLEAGINDLKVIGLNRKSASAIKESCFRNIESILKMCVERNIKVILINLFPVGRIEPLRRLVWNPQADSAIYQINRRLKSLEDNNNIFYFDAFSLLSDEKFKVRRDFRNGFLHINDEAYKVLSDNIKKQIERMINLKINN